MRTAVILAAAAALSAIGTAASARVTDAEYIQASRCHALAAAQGGEATESLGAFVKTEARGRPSAVMQMADQAAAKAKREARSDNPERRARLDAELGGVCQALIGADQTTGTAARPQGRPAS